MGDAATTSTRETNVRVYNNAPLSTPRLANPVPERPVERTDALGTTTWRRLVYRVAKGFTLIELLVVIGIITLMAGILLPVFISAKRNARRASSTSNLHQCGLVLSMYCDDYGGYDSMPTGYAAAQILKQAPTCDPSDTWRGNCSDNFGAPLIGSYGYIRSVTSVSSQSQWQDCLRVKQNPTLLVSIFYADRVPLPFHGDTVNYTAACGIDGLSCQMPDRVVRLRLDGSMAVTSQSVSLSGAPLLCSWEMIFLDDDPTHPWTGS